MAKNGIQIDITGMEAWMAVLDKKEQGRVILRALNRTGSRAKTESKRAIKKVYGIKRVSEIWRFYKSKKATASNPVYIVLSAVDRGSLKLYKYFKDVYQTAAGVMAVIRQNRPTVRYRKSFVATMRSGHIGAFTRTSERNAQGRQKIKERQGPSPARMLKNITVDREFNLFSSKFFKQRFKHEIDNFLNGKIKRLERKRTKVR